ncbi:hypothetical protein C0Q70_18266 [Pomacea canaliculata]|uniref:Tudor domain-containing protein 5 n=1 Tax=Pomacea canaliculata TaxID=400727 RepID=A0A2T7NMR8_POMCA|nr:hypothetical protein C0Q70_18266 [Pomacea canaliculata]
MGKVDPQKEECKKKIRSLLLSAPLGLTLDELRNDYEEFLGEVLPSRKFGYQTDMEFLQDIPDVIKVEKTRDGRLAFKAAYDETTKHIAKMVANQKVEKSKWGVANPRKGRGGRRGNNGRQRKLHSFPAAPDRYHRHETKSPSAPQFLLIKIKEFLALYPDGIPLDFFHKVFNKWIGMHVDLQRLGYSNIETLITDIPDIAQIREYQHGEKRVVGMQPSRPLKNISSKPLKSPESLHSNSSTCMEEKQTNHNIDESQSSESWSEEHSEDCTNEPDEISFELQKKIREVLLRQPSGLWASRLPFAYKALWKEDLPFGELGYLSVVDFVSALPDIVHVDRPNPKGDWLLTDATQQKPEQAPIQSQKNNPRMQNSRSEKQQTFMKAKSKNEEILRESVSQVLQVNPDGIPVLQFPEVYKEMTGRKLDPKQFGMNDLHDLFISLSDVLRIEYREKNASRLFSIPGKGTRHFHYLLDAWKPHALGDDLEEAASYNSDIPEDAVGPGVCYTPVTLPNPKNRSEHFEIYVSNIVSPGLFWIQLRGSTTTGALESLMNGLESVYEARGELYRMPECLMTYGQVCATLFPEDNNWHRGIITGESKSGMIEMYFVDYGSTCFVPKRSIRFLAKKFLRLPTQAIQAELAYTKPFQEKWSLKAKERLLELCRCKPLVAFMTSRKDRVLSLILCDTSGPTDIHINDTLVNEKLALFEHEEEEEEPPASNNSPQSSESWFEATGLSSTRQSFVQRLGFGKGFIFHIISIKNTLYLTSGEVSSLFWEEDIIGSMLIKNKFHVKKMCIRRDEYPALFEELERLKVWNVKESTQMLSLYCLDGIEPNGRDCRGQEEATSLLKTAKDVGIHQMTSVDELSLALNSLQIRRKRILKEMMSASECSPQAIQELDRVEQVVKDLQTRLTHLESVSSLAVESVTNQNPSVNATANSLLDAAKSNFSLNKNTLLSSPAAIKTNVVSPLIVQPPTNHTVSMPGPALQGMTASGDMTLSQLVAANIQMATLIQQQDTFLKTMLQASINPALSSMPSGHMGLQSLASSTALGIQSTSLAAHQVVTNPLLPPGGLSCLHPDQPHDQISSPSPLQQRAALMPHVGTVGPAPSTHTPPLGASVFSSTSSGQSTNSLQTAPFVTAVHPVVSPSVNTSGDGNHTNVQLLPSMLRLLQTLTQQK